jgi:protein TonB
METKKTEGADLEKKSPLFFSIGLIITMSMVVYAFERQGSWNQGPVVERSVNLFIPTIEVPITDQLQPQPPVLKQVQIIEVPDDETLEKQIEPIIDFGINSSYPENIAAILKEEPKEEAEPIVDFAEESAAPKDGVSVFYKYVADKIKYPAQARRMGIEGRVFVQFIIGRDGSVSEVKAIKGIGAGCDEEAVRIIKGSPAWNPGRQGGRTVKQRMVLPITFRLN